MQGHDTRSHPDDRRPITPAPGVARPAGARRGDRCVGADDLITHGGAPTPRDHSEPSPDAALALVDALPLPLEVREVLTRLGACAVVDLTSFAPGEFEVLHGLGRPGRLLIEDAVIASGVSWMVATRPSRPTKGAREAGKTTLAEVGLTDTAQAELSALHNLTLRGISTWSAEALASAVAAETFAEATAALDWYRLSFLDTASAPTFLEGVRHIREHYDEHGFVPGAREMYNGFRLGQWVMMTRQNFNARKLDPSRIHVLAALPYWTWTGGHSLGITSKRLADILEAARGFAARHGHVDVPNVDEHAFLYRGVKSVRDARQSLSAAAMASFEALPNWTWDEREAAARRRHATEQDKAERPPSPRWLSRLAELNSEATTAGGLDQISLRGTEREKIGHWASVQRARRQSLSPTQRSLLEAIPGWTWDGMAARDARRWNDCFSRLETFVAAGNSPDVPVTKRYEDFGVGDWVRRQHRNRENLTAEQIERLEALPGWAWRKAKPQLSRSPRVSRTTVLRREARWEATRRLAVSFFEEHHVWPSSGTLTPSGVDLGAWAISQRSLRARGELAPRREATLDATPGWRWNGQAQRGTTGPNLFRVCNSLGLEPGAILVARGKKYTAEAILDDDYRIEVVSSPGQGAYETPTRAWLRATAGQSSVNGWDAWSIEFEGRMTPLRDLRDRVSELNAHEGADANPA